jgi:hypothetical protein
MKCVDLALSLIAMLTLLLQCAKILRDGGPKSLVILDGTPVPIDIIPLLTYVQNSDEEHLRTTEWRSQRYVSLRSFRNAA